MTKDKNDPSPDPERSTAAKKRKPPPNPWAELRQLRITAGELDTRLVGARELIRQADAKCERADANIHFQAQLASAYSELSRLYSDQVREYKRGIFSRNGRRIRQLDVLIAEQQDRIDKLDRIDALADARGRIQGLAARPHGTYHQD